MRAYIQFSILCVLAGCSDGGSPVAGRVEQLPFTTTHGLFGLANDHVDLFNYDGCAWFRDPSTAVPEPSFQLQLSLDSGGALLPGEFALDPGELAKPARAMWVVTGGHDVQAAPFTGGTISITRVTSATVEGEIAITSPDGDYAIGEFTASACPEAGVF